MSYTNIKRELIDYQIELEGFDDMVAIGSDVAKVNPLMSKSKYVSFESMYLVSIESVESEVQKFFKIVVDAAKKFWQMIVSFAVKFGNVIKKLMSRVAGYAKSFFSKEKQVSLVATEAKRLIAIEQQSSNPNMDIVNEIVNVVATVVDNQNDVTEVTTTSEAITLIDNLVANPIRLRLDNIQYTIDQEHFNVFGYDKNQEVFSVSQIDRQRKLNAHYYRLVEAFKEHLNPDILTEVLVGSVKGKSAENVTLKGLRKEVCDKLIEPFFTLEKVEDEDNLSPDNRIMVNLKSVKQIYQSGVGSNLVHAFKKALKSLSGSVGPADTSRFVKATSIKTNRATMNTMLEAIQNTIKDIEQNRNHLYIGDKQIQEGFMLTEQGLRRLMHDLGVNKHPSAKGIANEIINICRTADTLVNQQHHMWLMVTNVQIQILNKQLKAIMSAKPVILKQK